MQVTTTGSTSQASKATHSPHEKKFDQAWQRVINQQKENDNFREEALAFVRDTRIRMQSEEQAYMDAMHSACLHLLTFFNRKTLGQWQRQTLMDWVSRYLDIMQANPYGAQLNLELIRQGLVDALPAAYPDAHLYSDDPTDDFLSHLGGSPMSDKNDPAAEFEQADAPSGPGQTQDEADADDAFFDGFFQQQQAHEQQRQDESQALKRLMKASSVNKLFRKVAGILHPDKEQDETARQEKNRLMSELIQARDTNDIPRIFAFYAEYVGQSPLQELGEDLDSVTQLLERQYLYLCDLKERILDDDPPARALYRHFHRKTPAARQRVINKHLKEAQTFTSALLALPLEVTSLNKLKPYLELHYDVYFEDEVFDFM